MVQRAFSVPEAHLLLSCCDPSDPKPGLLTPPQFRAAVPGRCQCLEAVLVLTAGGATGTWGEAGTLLTLRARTARRPQEAQRGSGAEGAWFGRGLRPPSTQACPALPGGGDRYPAQNTQSAPTVCSHCTGHGGPADIGTQAVACRRGSVVSIDL